MCYSFVFFKPRCWNIRMQPGFTHKSTLLLLESFLHCYLSPTASRLHSRIMRKAFNINAIFKHWEEKKKRPCSIGDFKWWRIHDHRNTLRQLSENFASPIIKRTAIRGRCTGGGTIRGAVNELRLVAFGTSGPGVAANCVNYRIKWYVHLKCSTASENWSWPNWMNPACWRILLCNIWKWTKWKQA